MKNLKPFDLQAALSGKAVMLRNGEKAFVRHHETELPVSKDICLIGFLQSGDRVSWCESGDFHYSDRASSYDIIGMYPETRVINGFEVPAPETKEPEHRDDYYLAATTSEDLYRCETWTGHHIDTPWLERGLVFLNAEDAIATTKAMLGIDPSSKDKT